jgi:hypothetical protein
MDVTFTRGRLEVGRRQRDWMRVYCSKTAAAEAEGDKAEKDIEKLCYTSGKKSDRDRYPLVGEIIWYPWYDPDRFEAKPTADKKRLQELFMCDAFEYMDEKNPDKVAKLEKWWEGQNGTPRCKEWFAAARKTKKQKLRRRKDNARALGVPFNSTEITSDSEEDDEAYESMDEEENQEMGPMAITVKKPTKDRKADGTMGPPQQRPDNKRKAPSTSKPAPKKKPKVSLITGRRTNNARSPSPGGFRQRNQRQRTTDPLRGDDEDENNDETDDHNSQFDPREPTPLLPNPRPRPRNPDGDSGGAAAIMELTPPATGNRRANLSISSGDHEDDDDEDDGIRNLKQENADEDEDEEQQAEQNGTTAAALSLRIRSGSELRNLRRAAQAQNVERQREFTGRTSEERQREANGRYDEDEAEQVAIRMSMQPEERRPAARAQEDEDEEERDFQAALRASMQPEMLPGGGRRSVEGDDD